MEWEESLCRTSARIATVFLWRTISGGFRRRRSTAVGGVQSVEKGMNGEPNRILVVQLGTKEDEATFFRAHGVLQGLSENLINALKLLANQQKDGDSPIQNIIIGLKEKCWDRIMNGLRSFMTSDNYSAVEVGHLRRGQRPSRS